MFDKKPKEESKDQKEWDNWGGKSASEKEAQNVLDEIRASIKNHQVELDKYNNYKKLGLNVDNIISAVQNTIGQLYEALNQKLKEYKSENLNVT